MNVRFLLGLLLLLPAVLLAESARADDQTACLDAAAAGQRLQATQKLVEARDQFRVCVAPQCPSAVKRDCANWYSAIEHALSSVVIAAKDEKGADLVGVRVSIDGMPLAPELEGMAVPVDAGPHTFHFESSGRASVDQQVLIREAEKNQLVAIVLGPSPAAPIGSTDEGARAGKPTGAWRTLGWALGGAGLVGLGVGAVSGVIALVDKNGADCDDRGVCTRGTVGAIKTAALLSDIGWATGAVCLGSGSALVLFGPQANGVATTGVRVVPVAAPGGAAVLARGSW